MNFENSKTSDLHKLLLNLTDKLNLKRNDKYVALSNLSIYQTFIRKIQKSHTKIVNLKYQVRHGMTNFNHLMDHILCIRYSRLF